MQNPELKEEMVFTRFRIDTATIFLRRSVKVYWYNWDGYASKKYLANEDCYKHCGTCVMNIYSRIRTHNRRTCRLKSACIFRTSELDLKPLDTLIAETKSFSDTLWPPYINQSRAILQLMSLHIVI